MLKPFLSAALAAAVISFLSPAASFAQQHHSGGGGRSSNDTYIVIQVMTKSRTNDGKTEYKKDYKAITTKSLRDEQKHARDDYDQAVKLWKDEMKSDPKTPRPVKYVPKQVSGSPIFETQTGAQEYIDKLKEEDEKKNPDKNK